MATVVNFIDTTLQAAASRTVNLPTAQITLPPSAFFHVPTSGVGSPTSITFSPTLKDLAGTINFTCTGGTLTNVTATSADLTYANMSASTATVTAAVTVNGSTYTTLCTVSKVLDGATGTNTCRVYAYQRSASAPTGTPGDVTVTFASNSITYPAALANGWVFDIPTTNGNPLYVTAISGAGSGATVNLLSAGWSGAAVMATDGPGGTGTNGTNGLNSATITIYQRSATATALSLPSASTTYTFATGVLTGLNNGWSTAYPAVDSSKPFVQMSLATAIAAAATDAIAASEWNAAQLQYDATAVINAQASADAANASISNITANGILDMGEKPEIIQKWTVIQAEFNPLQVQADSLSVSHTGYDSAYSALFSYLDSINTAPAWTNVTVDTPITRATFNTKFSDYYAAKLALMNAVVAKSAYAPSLVIGARNLYSKVTPLNIASGACFVRSRTTSGFVLEGNAAATGVIRMAGVISANGPYTISFDLALSVAGGYPLSIDFCDGTSQVINPTTTAQHFSLTFSVSNADATYNFVDFTNLSGQLYTFTNFKIGVGSKDTGWTPSPEDVAADTAAAQSAADAAANTANTVNTTINSPPVISTISNVTATNVYKPAVTIATKTPGVTAGVGPFIFDWREENITVGDVDITYTLSSASNTNDTCTIKAISQVTGGLPSQDRVTVTVTDVKGRVSITQFTVNASC